MESLLTLSGTRLAEMIRMNKISSQEIVEKHIERIQKVNPVINAVVKDRFEEAKKEAREADKQVEAAGGEGLPPFHGVPCTIKESLAHTGMPNTCGLMHRKDVISSKDATAVSRLRNNGAICLGVTNIPELCMWVETYSNIYGRCCNPYDSKRITGGSSGGEGAIIGAGGSPFGLGSDIAGSIRYPAFFNGVCGHKPTGGLIPTTGHYPQPGGKVGSYMTVGPLARRAEDLYPLLKLLAGPDDEDESCRQMELGDPAGLSLEDLTIISVEHHGSFRVDNDLRRAQRRCVDSLAEKGAKVIRKKRLESMDWLAAIWISSIIPNLENSMEEMLTGQKHLNIPREIINLIKKESHHTSPMMLLVLVEKLYKHLQNPITGNKLSAGISKMEEIVSKMKEELDTMMGENGVIFYPSFSTPAPIHGRTVYFPLDITYMMMSNILEYPATQVPLGLNARGLPLGMQIIGKQGYDHLTIATAMEAEKALGGWLPPWEW